MPSPEELARETFEAAGELHLEKSGALGDHFQTTMISFLNSSFFLLPFTARREQHEELAQSAASG